MTGAEAMLACLPLVVLLGGHRPMGRITPSCSGHYPSGQKKVSVYRPSLPKTRKRVDPRVITAHAYYRASQAIVFSYMIGMWAAWHIRRRP